MTTHKRTQRALAGIRVLELAPSFAGALVGQHLGDLGADVIKVEPPRGDPLRAQGTFAAANRNKRSLRLELSEGADRDVLTLHLLRTSDVLIDGYSPGELSRHGFGYPAVARVAPRVVYCSISAYGQEGPYSSRVGEEANVAAVAGLASFQGDGNARPSLPPPPVTSAVGALYAAMSILAALRARERLGEGQHIDLALSDAAATLLAGEVLQRGGRAPGRTPGEGVYLTKDGTWLSVAAGSARAWKRLCELVDLPELARARADGTDEKGLLAADEALASALQTRTRAEWIDRLADDEVGVAPVHDRAGAEHDPHLVDRGVFASVASGSADGSRARLVRFPAHLPATPSEISRPPPALGQHDEELLRELGISGEELAKRLARPGTIPR